MREHSEEPKFYVYAHVRNDTGHIFYIGKGYGRRAFVTQRRSSHWTNIVKKAGHRVEFLGLNLTEKEALDLEMKKIAEIGRENLCNMTIGGDGLSGYKMTDTQRQIVIKNLTGRVFSEETRRKISEAHIGRKRDRSVVEAHAKKIRGRKQSAEHIESRRKGMIGHIVSPETRAKIAASNTGQKRSNQTRERLSISHIGKKRSEESKAKQIQAFKALIIERKDEMYGKMMKAIKCSNGMEFKSLSEAAEWVASWKKGVKAKGAISRCALGRSKTAYELTWSYI